jgi:pimeloyl-ACP methyl ester carboxylesterase
MPLSSVGRIVRRVKALLGLLFALAVVAGCATQPHDENFAGLVDIGGGRWLYLTCQGSGSPTVFVIPGKGSNAEAWNIDRVTRTTRVCAYDRPNTRPAGSDRSTPVPQPHSLPQAVDDVVKLLAAARLSIPVIVVGHSYGGLVADLLARSHPKLVAGLVFVDPTSEFLPRLGRPDQDAEFDRAAREPTPDPEGEGFLADDAFTLFKTAPLLPKVPAAVLSSDKFPPLADATRQDYTKYQIHRANSLLAETLATENVIIADSGHDVMLHQPDVVADRILAIVDKVRARN